MTIPEEQSKVWYLRHLDLLLSLSDDEIEQLARLLDDHFVPAGGKLLHDRQHARVYLIKHGAVRLYISEVQQETTIALLGRGRMFGLSSRIGEVNPAMGAVTLESSYICSVTWERIRDLMVHHPTVMLRMTQSLLEQIFLAETWIERVSTQSPRMRLARLLIELGQEFGEPAPEGVRVKFRLTQADLARMLHLSRETVSRLTNELQRAGVISRVEGHLLIHDQAAVAALARGGDEPES